MLSGCSALWLYFEPKRDKQVHDFLRVTNRETLLGNLGLYLLCRMAIWACLPVIEWKEVADCIKHLLF